MTERNGSLRGQVRNELIQGKDQALIAATARQVVAQAASDALSRRGRDFAGTGMIATELIQHGRELEPNNPEWDALTEGLRQLPAAPRADAATVPATIRIGGAVAAAGLT